MRRRAALMVAAAALAAGCAAPAPTPSASPLDSTPRGGTLKVGLDLAGYESFQVDEDRTFDHAWDPQTTWAQEPWELFRCCLLRTLMSFNGLSTSEGGAELRPDLAVDDPTISADGLTWTFHLKPGLHYAPPMADVPIVAADVVRALERTLRPDPITNGEPHPFGPYSFNFADVIAGAEDFSAGKVSSISGLEVPDAQTLVIHLLRPAGDLGARLAMPAAAPIPAGASEGHDTGYGRYLVASGPYMIEGSEQLNPSLPPDRQPVVAGYVPATSLTLVRNPSWTDDELRRAYVDRIEIEQIDSFESELADLIDGRIDLAFIDNLEVADITTLRADSNVAPRVHVASRGAADYVAMNLAVPPFDDVHVRRAVNLATDKRAIVTILDPSARVLTHAIPDAFENDLLTNYDPFATVDSAGSIVRAKAEMALSRYDTDHDGVCDAPACQAIYVPVNHDEDGLEHSRAGRVFADQLAPLGVELDIQDVIVEEFYGYVTDPAQHAALTFTYGWGSDYQNASAWFAPLAGSGLLGTSDTGNLSLTGADAEQLAGWGYEITDVPSVDRQIDQCIALTGAAQFACWAAVDQYLMERVVPWVPIDNRQVSRVTSDRVVRFSFDQWISMPSLEQLALRPGQ